MVPCLKDGVFYETNRETIEMQHTVRPRVRQHNLRCPYYEPLLWFMIVSYRYPFLINQRAIDIHMIAALHK